MTVKIRSCGWCRLRAMRYLVLGAVNHRVNNASAFLPMLSLSQFFLKSKHSVCFHGCSVIVRLERKIQNVEKIDEKHPNDKH